VPGRTRKRRFPLPAPLSVGVLLAALGWASPASAAGNPQTGRPSVMVPVGAAPVIPRGALALGPAATSMRLRFDVVLSPRYSAGLQHFAAAVSEPGSAVYRHYLTPAQFASRFGQDRSVLRQVEGALQRAGLRPGPVPVNRLLIPIATTVGRASAALRTRFERYRLASGRVALANTSAPQLPAVVARVTQAVIGLSNLVTVVPRPPIVERPRAGHRPTAGASAGPQPCQAATAAAQQTGGWTYNQLANAYSGSELYAKGEEGAGVTVALFELQPWAASDISAFQSCYGTSSPVTSVPVDMGATGSAGEEATLDIETAIAMAPTASFLVYNAPSANYAQSTIDEYTKIVNDDQASVLSSSYGACEAIINQQAPGLIASENTIFQQAATEGISVFVASGDTGSEACYQADHAMTQLGVQDPASQPYVTSVGGTDLTSLGPPPTEQVWNEAATMNGASGGGISSVWKMPAWQHGSGVISQYSSGTPCNAAKGYCREVPDVSASADPFHPYVIDFGGAWTVVAGTSGAAPLWAALLADIDSQTSPALRAGFLNPVLYSLSKGNFNDITSGNNDYLQNNGGRFPAGTGFDMATGLGTPIGVTLARAWRPWQAVEGTLPSGAVSFNYLSSAACKSSTSCVAVGSYTAPASFPGNAQGLILTGSGASWKSAQAPRPPNAVDSDAPDDGLRSVACPSKSECVAVGDYPDAAGNEGLLLIQTSTSWKPFEAPVPANADPTREVAASSVACPSPSACVAVGTYRDSLGTTRGLLLTWNGANWQGVQTPLPADAQSSGLAELSSVACSSATSCTAVGWYRDSAHAQQGLLVTGFGSNWAPSQAPLPSDASTNPAADFNGITCQTTRCIAVGQYTDSLNNQQGLLVTGFGPNWTPVKAPLPANASTSPGQASLSTVTCRSGACVSVGTYTDSSSYEDGLILTQSKSSWKPKEATLPANAGRQPASLDSVSCPASICVAVGSYGGQGDGRLLLSGSGSSWTPVPVPLPSSVTSLGGTFGPVTCATFTDCVVVGSYITSSAQSSVNHALLASGPA
jgi:hypothetical protein